MFKTILLALLCVHIFALDITMDSAQDDFSTYSILKITDKEKFICQKIKDDFSVTSEVICAFSKPFMLRTNSNCTSNGKLVEMPLG